jgi:hypothetical protein
MPASAQQVAPTPDPTVTTLQREKLAEEVAKLKQETVKLRNQNEDPWGDWLRNNAVVVSGAIVALIGVFRWFAERRQERNKRDEDRLSAVFDGLGSPNEVSRINAAHNLRTFLEPGYERFHTRILYVVVAHLRHQSKPEDDEVRPVTQGRITVWRRQSEPKRAELPLFTQALVSIFKAVYPHARPKRSVGRWVAERPLFNRVFTKALHAVFSYWKAERVFFRVYRPWLRPGSPLDMSGVQLPGAYLINTNLSGVWMPHANLTGANFFTADLTRAIFNGAILTGADLTGADLTRASFAGATLTGATLQGASLNGADLSWANLTDADFYLADLTGADLNRADLTRANLYVATLTGATLTGATLTGTDLRAVTGLAPEQRQMAADRGALVDEP